jgi:hypothetical protein
MNQKRQEEIFATGRSDNVTAPQAKLHIRADENYDTASVFIQAYNDNKPAYFWMGNKNFAGFHNPKPSNSDHGKNLSNPADN